MPVRPDDYFSRHVLIAPKDNRQHVIGADDVARRQRDLQPQRPLIEIGQEVATDRRAKAEDADKRESERGDRDADPMKLR